MSVASSPSFSCIKLHNPSSPPPSSYSSYSPSTSSSSSSSSFKFTIRSSQAEGPLRRPVAPAPVKPVPPSPSPPAAPPAASPPPIAPPKPANAVVQDKNVITLEFQRQKAKELQEYFKQKKLEEANQGPFFGFIGKNEIANGRNDVTIVYMAYTSAMEGERERSKLDSWMHSCMLKLVKNAIISSRICLCKYQTLPSPFNCKKSAPKKHSTA